MLFLQNLELQNGTSTVLEGVAIGLACTAVVGVLTFWLHHKLPYRRMLILTGALVAIVLMVMIGGTALSFMDLGWIPSHPTPFTVPDGWAPGSRSTRTGRRSEPSCSPAPWSSAPTCSPSTSRSGGRVQKGEQPAVRARRPSPLQTQTEPSRPIRYSGGMRRSPGKVVLVAALASR